MGNGLMMYNGHYLGYNGRRLYIPTANNTFNDAIYDGNTVGWYSSDASITLVGNTVSIWGDKSGAGHNLTQATGIAQPVWSSDGITFNSSTWMQTGTYTFDQPQTEYVVFKWLTPWSQDKELWGGIEGNAGKIYMSNTEGFFLMYNGVGGAGGVVVSSYVPVNTWCIARVLAYGAGSSIQINASTKTTGSTGINSPNGLTLSNSDPGYRANFAIKEIIVRKTDDTDVKEQLIYDYLYNKYLINPAPSFLYDGSTVGWYSYDTSITLVGDASVSAWGDKSGNNHNLIQSDGISQPMWTSDGISFDGTNDWLQVNLPITAQPFTYYIVYSTTNIVDGNALITGGSGSAILEENDYGIGGLRLYAGVGADVYSADSAINMPLNTFVVVTAVFNGVSSYLTINNHAGRSGDAKTDGWPLVGSGQARLFIGATNNSVGFNQMVAKEIIIRTNADESSNRLEVINYLNRKYSLY